MDLEKSLTFAETYAREYVRYLLEFFGRAPDAVNPKDARTPEGKVVLFAMLSAALGAFLGQKFISGGAIAQGDLMIRVLLEFLYWLSLSILLELALFVLRAAPDFMDSILTTLKVLPVAYAMSGFAAFLAYNLALAFMADPVAEPEGPHNAARAAAAFAELAVCAVYLPTSLRRLHKTGWLRAILASLMVLLVISMVHFTAYWTTVKAPASPTHAITAPAGAPRT